MLFTRWKPMSSIRSAAAPGSFPPRRRFGFYEKMGYTYMDGYRVRRKDDGLFYMEKHLK